MARFLIGNVKGPKGNKGDQGIQGIQGVTGKQGEQGIPGPTVVKVDDVIQNQVVGVTSRTANPSYVAVQFKTTDGKVLAIEVPASQVRISNDVTLDTVLNGNSFYHSHTEEHLNLCNYAEWVTAGKPTMPTDFTK